jgi:predicted RNA-binding protein
LHRPVDETNTGNHITPTPAYRQAGSLSPLEGEGRERGMEEIMCETNAYLVKDGKEELILEDISILRPEEEELYLQNIFGEQKRIKARLKEMNLIGHRIVLEEG